MTVINNVPVLFESIEKDQPYTAQEFHYYSQFYKKSRERLSNDISRIKKGLDLSVESSNKTVFQRYIQSATLPFERILIRKGATGPVEVRQVTNINVFGYCSIKLFPAGLESISPWKILNNQDTNAKFIESYSDTGDFKLTPIQLFYRVDSDDFMLLPAEFTGVNGGRQGLDSRRLFENWNDFYESGPPLLEIPLVDELIFKIATEQQSKIMKEQRKTFLPTDYLPWREESVRNETFVNFVNSVITDSVSNSKLHSGLKFVLNVQNFKRTERFYSRDENILTLPLMDWHLESEAFKLFPNGYDVKFYNAQSWSSDFSHAPLDLTSKFDGDYQPLFLGDENKLLQHLGKKDVVKLSLKGEWGKTSYNFSFAKSSFPLLHSQDPEYTIVVVISAEIFGRKNYYVVGAREMPDGSIGVNTSPLSPAFTLIQKDSNYFLKESPDLILTPKK